MLLLVLTILACGALEQESNRPGEQSTQATAQRLDVEVDVLATAIKGGARVIDVRTAAEFNSGHVPGAVSIPMDQLTPGHLELASHLKTEPLYLICHSGGRSARAADKLVLAGFRAFNVLGGTAAWRDRGFEVE